MRKRLLSILIIMILMITSYGCSNTKSTGSENTQTNESSQDNVKQSEQEADSTNKTAEWIKDAVIYEVNIRQYTKEGTFQAFSKHLERLHNMGITVLWLMPIYPISQENRIGTLGSYYSIQDFTGINPEFGTKEDFKKLVDQAHELGFYVILDWVGNHSGWDCEWITNHPEWYEQDTNGTIISPPGTGWNDVAQLNYENNEFRDAMLDAMNYWVDTYGIDGFRCDYAGGVPLDFWETARAKLNQKADLFWLAENDTNLSLLENAFDANYNWNLYDTLKKIVEGAKKCTSIKYYIGDGYPEGSFPMNFLDNHDKNSYEGTIISNFGTEALPAMMALIYTLPGIPMLYSGDEAGLDHSLEFFEKDEILWTETIPYEGILTALAKIRTEHAPLYSGSYGGKIELLDVGNPYVLAFRRDNGTEQITVIMNLSKSEESVDLSACAEKSMTQLMYGQGSSSLDIDEKTVTSEGITGVTILEPWEFWILSSK